MPIHPGANGPAGPISLLPLPITTKSEKRQSHKSPQIIVRCVAGPTDFRSRFERFLSQVPTRCVASPHFGPDVPRKSASQRVQRCRWPIFCGPATHLPWTCYPFSSDLLHCALLPATSGASRLQDLLHGLFNPGAPEPLCKDVSVGVEQDDVGDASHAKLLCQGL